MNAKVESGTNIAVQENNDFVVMLERVALNPELDPQKLMQLLDVKERVLKRSAEAEFNAAMNACQISMTKIATDAKNSETHSRYASYAALDAMLRPIYTVNGFSLNFGSEETTVANCIRVCCDISHRGGHTKHVWMDIPADGKGPKGGDVMTKVHAHGAAMTYGMRYLLKAIFNVAIGDDDNDGNSGQELEKVWKTSETRKHYATELMRAWGKNDAPYFYQLWMELDSDQQANIWRDFNSVQRREMTEMTKEQREKSK